MAEGAGRLFERYTDFLRDAGAIDDEQRQEIREAIKRVTAQESRALAEMARERKSKGGLFRRVTQK